MRTRRRLAGLCLAAGLCLGVTVTALASEQPVAIATGSSDATRAVGEGTVVFLGVGGLRWSDVDPQRTPNLYGLAERSANAAMAVRTALPSSCPLDGWLTLNSGTRAIGPRPAGRCTPVPAPVLGPQGVRFPGWSDLVAPNAEYSYDPMWGTLAAHARPGTRCAVGPGAALALAAQGGAFALPSESGKLSQAEYRGELPRLDLGGCDLALIDGGKLPEGRERPAAVRALDALVGDLDEERRLGETLVVAGISDSDADSSHLTAVLVRPANGLIEFREPHLLHSASTRQTGLVQLTDLTATLLAAAAPQALPGSALTIREVGGFLNLPDEFDVSAQTVRSGFVPLFGSLIGGQILAWTAIALAWRQGMSRSRAASLAVLVGLCAGALPVSTYLVNLAPWSELSHPAAGLWTGVGIGSVVIAWLARRLGSRFGPYGPPTGIAALTVLVLAADVAASSRLQLGSPFGLSPLVAGRFYGFGNIAFAVFAMCTLLVATAAWVGLRARYHDRAAVLALIGIGAVALVVDGAPGLGTDFGGVLALAPGLGVLALLLAGIRLSVIRLTGVAIGSVVAVGALSVADWSRPEADRTHLGRFVQDVLDGEALDVLGRKAQANFGLFTNPLIVLAAFPLLVAAILALVRPSLLRLHGLAEVQRTDPAFRALLVAALTTALLGFAVNDSGIIVPAVALFAGAPLFVAVWAQRWATESPVASGQP